MLLRPAEDLALFTAEMAAWPGAGRADATGRQTRATGSRPTTHCRRDIIDSSATRARSRAASCPTPPSCRGGRAAGPTTRTSGSWSTTWSRAATSRLPAARAASGCGTSPSGSTPTTSRCPRRGAAAPRRAAAACARHRPGHGDRDAERAQPRRRAPARRRSSRASAARGGSTRRTSTDSAALPRPRRPAVSAGPAGLRPQADGELFDFDYQLEMYKPVAKRRWGYWAMPVLYGDRLVGKLDATADRDAGVLRVDAVHEDGDWTRTMRSRRRPRDRRAWPAGSGWSRNVPDPVRRVPLLPTGSADPTIGVH